jgi:hypothetical protein
MLSLYFRFLAWQKYYRTGTVLPVVSRMALRGRKIVIAVFKTGHGTPNLMVLSATI